MRRWVALMGAAALVAAGSPARASAPGVFGHGARSAALARADVAGGCPSGAAAGNAALGAAPGFRLRLGYAYSAVGLTLNGADAGVRDVSGVDVAAQLGAAISPLVDVGVALAAHIPDAGLAAISFRPATEPQFPLYEAALQRTSVDFVGSLRYGAVSVGVGVALGLGVAGDGTAFNLEQDATGVRADAAMDVELPYRLAPIIGARLELGRLALGAAFRGASAIDLRLESESRIALEDNPLNGTTRVQVRGASGYEPALVDLGAALSIGGVVVAHAALEYAIYSAAPPPVADVTVDVRLGTTPSQREARFIEPRFRDTLSPRIGVEIRGAAEEARAGESVGRSSAARAGEPGSAAAWRWALRAGYALAPSPVPRQTGFTSYADATRHVLALGGGLHLGRAFGVDVSVDAAAGLHLFAARLEEKASDALPHARYEVDGRIWQGALSMEGAWR